MENTKPIVKIAHKYIVGGMEDIKTGRLEDLTIEFPNLEETKGFYAFVQKGPSRIYIQKLIGVYRKVDINLDPTAEEISGESYFPLGDSRKRINPGLVQIGFDPEGFTRELVENYLGKDGRRILVRPFKEMSSAESLPLSMYQEFLGINAEQLLQEKIPKDKKQELLSFMRQLLKTDGLTKIEFELLRANSSILF